MPDAFSTLIWGRPKTGKSTYLLSYPGPIHVFDFDVGLSTLTTEAPGQQPGWASEYPVKSLIVPESGTEVFVHKFRTPSLDPTHAQNAALLAEFERRYLAILNQVIPCRTLGIDTDSQFWSLVASVKTEEARQAREDESYRTAKSRAERNKQPIPPRSQFYTEGAQRDYGLANAYYERAVLGVKSEGINLVIVDRHADVWVTDENGRNPGPGGEIKPKGNKMADAFVDLVLRADWYEGASEPSAVVELSRFRTLKAGTRLTAPDYDVVMALAGRS